MDIVDGNDKLETKNAIDNLGISDYPFKLNEFKEILTEFNCIDDYKFISEYPNIIDAKESIGMPDYLFIPKMEGIPVCITIHLDRNLYAITTLFPNPRKNPKAPFCYGIQIIPVDKEKDELRVLNEAAERYRKSTKIKN